MNQKEFNKILNYCIDCTIGVTGRAFPVRDGSKQIPDEIGWCTEKGIYLNYKHELIDKLPIKNQIVFMVGIFTHELMHHILSDFSILEKIMSKYEGAEARLMLDINNIVEDASIEYFSRLYIGGYLRKSLLFSIKSIYDLSKNVDDYKNPLTQCVNALIQYGDMGLIKGEVSQEVKGVLSKAIKVFDKAIEEPNSEARFEYAKEIKDIVKVLLPNQKEDNTDENNNYSSDSSNDGKNGKNSSGGNNNSSTSLESEENHEALDDLEDSLLENGNWSIPQGKGKAKETPDENDAEKLKKETSIKEDNKNKTKEKLDDDLIDSSDNTGNENSSSENRKKTSNEAIDFTSSENNQSNSKKEDGEVINTTDEISEKEIDEIVKEVKECIDIICDRNNSTSSDTLNDDFDITVKIGNGQYKPSVENKVMTSKGLSDDTYISLKNSLNEVITTLSNSLKRIFRQDMEEKEYCTTGKVSMRRLSSGQMSTRMFEKVKSPKNKKNISVLVLVDESGSMAGQNKSLNAKMTTIVLAEVFDRLKIPMSVIGFTTDMNRFEVNQHHYMHWNNSFEQRKALLSIGAYNCNFDSYSVRYATEMLKKQKTEHKILIIISDGEPSGGCLSRNDRFTDLVMSVKEARKVTNILAIGVGRLNIKNFKAFYGNDFVNITNVNQLPASVSMQVRNIIKKW